MNEFNANGKRPINRSTHSFPVQDSVAHPVASREELADLTRSLNELSASGGKGSNDVLPLVYDELRRHANHRMSAERRQYTLQPTALVHEAWLRLVGSNSKPVKWENRAHFFGAAARAMRRILIENIRRKTAIKRGGEWVRVEIDNVDLAQTSPEEKVLLIDEALEQLQQAHPDKAQVVMLKFFGGHSNREVAEMLGMGERSVERHWAYAKAWLMQCIRDQGEYAAHSR